MAFGASEYSDPTGRQQVTVAPGDTLYRFAQQSLPKGASHQDIMHMVSLLQMQNGIPDPNKIQVGQNLSMAHSFGMSPPMSGPPQGGLQGRMVSNTPMMGHVDINAPENQPPPAMGHVDISAPENQGPPPGSPQAMGQPDFTQLSQSVHTAGLPWQGYAAALPAAGAMVAAPAMGLGALAGGALEGAGMGLTNGMMGGESDPMALAKETGRGALAGGMLGKATDLLGPSVSRGLGGAAEGDINAAYQRLVGPTPGAIAPPGPPIPGRTPLPRGAPQRPPSSLSNPNTPLSQTQGMPGESVFSSPLAMQRPGTPPGGLSAPPMPMRPPMAMSGSGPMPMSSPSPMAGGTQALSSEALTSSMRVPSAVPPSIEELLQTPGMQPQPVRFEGPPPGAGESTATRLQPRAVTPAPFEEGPVVVKRSTVPKTRANPDSTDVASFDERVQNRVRKKPPRSEVEAAQDAKARAPNRKPKARDIGQARRTAKHARGAGGVGTGPLAAESGDVGGRQALPGGSGKMFKK